jgi:1-acyl-sn-glycerol-3-phosphate acyltransferase
VKVGYKLKIFAKIKLFYALFIVALFTGLYVIVAFPFRFAHNILRKITSKLIVLFLGIKIKQFGQEDSNVDMFIINHQSMVDIMVTEVVAKKSNIAWVAKTELFKIPFYGHSVKLSKMIELDRDSRQGIIKLLKDTKNRVENGRTVAIFPEGTRNVANKMLPFKKGAEIIANKLKLRVQPIVLVNSAKRFDSKTNSFSSGEVQVIFLKSFIASKNENWLEENREKMLVEYQKYIEN